MVEGKNNHFDVNKIKKDLKSRSVRGGTATVFGQFANFVIHTGSTIVLARLLMPADFGLIAMVTAVTGFANLFKDLGLSEATIQKDIITHEQVNALFWINMMVSISIFVLVVLMSPVIAWFYSEPRLAKISIAMSIVFLLGGAATQHQALLKRQMRFIALAVIRTVSLSAGVIAAIVGAAVGFRYWALVLMHTTSALVFTLGVWILCDWRPGRPTMSSGVRTMLIFGEIFPALIS